ncbi:hypothetical protein SO694_00002760 [Aureococcus anophagefferens]|uniref:DUF4201 domain-containing protein n=1 Tax=Aureococcus anophagefferens TaxID=44056 RepID=A0ABR1GD88_AURAN
MEAPVAKQPSAPKDKGPKGRGRGKGKSPRQHQAVIQEPVLERYEQAIRVYSNPAPGKPRSGGGEYVPAAAPGEFFPDIRGDVGAYEPLLSRTDPEASQEPAYVLEPDAPSPPRKAAVGGDFKARVRDLDAELQRALEGAAEWTRDDGAGRAEVAALLATRGADDAPVGTAGTLDTRAFAAAPDAKKIASLERDLRLMTDESRDHQDMVATLEAQLKTATAALDRLHAVSAERELFFAETSTLDFSGSKAEEAAALAAENEALKAAAKKAERDARLARDEASDFRSMCELLEAQAGDYEARLAEFATIHDEGLSAEQLRAKVAALGDAASSPAKAAKGPSRELLRERRRADYATKKLGFVEEEASRLGKQLAMTRAAKESEIPNFKGSFLGRFPLAMTQEARDLAVDKVRKLEESISGGTFGGSATPASPNAKAPPAGAPPGDARVEGLVRDDERSTPKAKGARRASAVNVKAASGRNRSASISLAMMKATEETLGASVKVDTQYSAEAKTRVEDFLTKMEHVRLVVQNQDRITSEVASLESRASQRLLDVAAAIDADDDERDECDVDLDDLGYDDVRTLGRSQVEAEVLCLRERVAAQTEAIATASSHKFNMDELDGVIGDIEASHAMERQERLKLQERLAALTKIGDLDRSRIASLEDDLKDWEARRGQLERLEQGSKRALSPAKPPADAHAGASKLQAAYRGKTVRAKAKQPPDDAAKVATFVRAAIRGSFAQLVARGGP